MTAATAKSEAENGPVDLCIIGGGINGTGIARDAAGRGLSVVLCEKGDLAEGTSSRSGKLIHGGLRYLEYYEFRLVREALIEREVLLEAAPHIIWPMRFVLPHNPSDRPAWLVRLGLLLYDHLGGRKRLRGTRGLNLRKAPEGRPIKPSFRKAFEFSDCWVDDARLVVLNAIDAHARGARILPRTTCASARRDNGVWHVDLIDGAGIRSTIQAQTLVNAAGPWVNDIVGRVIGHNASRAVRMVKGSHIVVRKFWEGGHAYLVQNDDKRVIFINPYENDLCLIGTTDIPYDGRAEDVTISDDEVTYLLRAVNRYLVRPLTNADIVHSFSGVRPLDDDSAADPSAVTRDYAFEIDAPDMSAPLLSIFGGKITTFRKLAEHALDRLKPFLPAMDHAWTARVALPGGDIDNADFTRFREAFGVDHPWLGDAMTTHFARLYGTRARQIVDGATSLDDLGRHFGGTFYQREAEYLIAEEWARTAEDILERRTKHGLHLSAPERQAFVDWMGDAV